MTLAAGLVRDWSYEPSPPTPYIRASRVVRSMLLRRGAPPHEVIVPAQAAARWSVYFAFLPDGVATAAHRYTLERLAAEPGKLMVVCATPSPATIPAPFRDAADALVWKGLGGFDFSAYAIALRHLTAASPGADVFVMNDSVLGPFASPTAVLADAPWDFAGFTASSLFENHVQSWAFQVRGLTDERLAAMAPVLPKRTTFYRYMDVVICQETRLARMAARAMSVGARWFADHHQVRNLSLESGVALVDQGVPFLKRSLLGRYSHLQDRAGVAAVLETHRHPVETAA